LSNFFSELLVPIFFPLAKVPKFPPNEQNRFRDNFLYFFCFCPRDNSPVSPSATFQRVNVMQIKLKMTRSEGIFLLTSFSCPSVLLFPFSVLLAGVT